MQRWLTLAILVSACAGPERGATPTPAPATARADAAPEVVAAPVPDAAPEVAAAPAPDAAPAAAEQLELTFMGDIMFGGTFSGKWCPEDVEEHDPLAAVAPLIASDLALANLETTVVDAIPTMKGDKRFAATPAQVSVLLRNGIGAVTLANNHVNDLDQPGIEETPRHLAELGIQVIGAPRADDPLVRVDTIEVRGWKIGFVAATTKLNRHQARSAPKVPFFRDVHDLEPALVPVIEAARADHDLVIVVLHWGVQYDDEPSDWQVHAAHAFIDAGASLVVGHHPHVLQGIERYKDGLIAYSLGNFVFQNGDAPSRDTGILRVGFARDRRCLDEAVFHPVILKRGDVHHVVPAKGSGLREVESRLVKLSKKKPLSTTWAADGDRFVTAAACER